MPEPLEKKKLGQLLIDRKLISQEQLDRALEYQKKDPRSLGEILHSFQLLSEEDLLKVLSMELGTEYFPTNILLELEVTTEVLRFIPREKALELMVHPLEYNETTDTLLVAMARPQNKEIFDEVKSIACTTRVEACIAVEYTLYRLIHKNYGEKLVEDTDTKDDDSEGFFLGSEDDSEAFPGIYGSGTIDEFMASQDDGEDAGGEFYLGGEDEEKNDPEERQGVSGNLMDLGLLEMLQIMGASGKTCRITIRREDERADIYMEMGRIVDCTLGDVRGEDAFYALIGWSEGYFQVKPDVTPDEKTIERSLDGLILEGLRRLDEENRV